MAAITAEETNVAILIALPFLMGDLRREAAQQLSEWENMLKGFQKW